MNKGSSKILIIAALICFVLFGIWYMYKNRTDGAIVFKNDYPAQTPEYYMKPAPTPEPEKSTYKVYITGEVLNPGVYEMEEGARVEDVIKVAGGLTDKAYDRSANLAAKVFDEQQIIIYNKDERENAAGYANENADAGKSEPGKININTAGADELAKLTGIGEAKAESIIRYREENGRFTSVEQIKNVGGIGDKIFEGIKNDITVD